MVLCPELSKQCLRDAKELSKVVKTEEFPHFFEGREEEEEIPIPTEDLIQQIFSDGRPLICSNLNKKYMEKKDAKKVTKFKLHVFCIFYENGVVKFFPGFQADYKIRVPLRLWNELIYPALAGGYTDSFKKGGVPRFLQGVYTGYDQKGVFVDFGAEKYKQFCEHAALFEPACTVPISLIKYRNPTDIMFPGMYGSCADPKHNEDGTTYKVPECPHCYVSQGVVLFCPVHLLHGKIFPRGKNAADRDEKCEHSRKIYLPNEPSMEHSPYTSICANSRCYFVDFKVAEVDEKDCVDSLSRYIMGHPDCTLRPGENCDNLLMNLREVCPFGEKCRYLKMGTCKNIHSAKQETRKPRECCKKKNQQCEAWKKNKSCPYLHLEKDLHFKRRCCNKSNEDCVFYTKKKCSYLHIPGDGHLL